MKAFSSLFHRMRKTTNLGNKLTWYLLFGVLVVMGLDIYFSLQRTRTNLLNDVRREVVAISRTVRVSLEKTADNNPYQHFAQLASEISGFENVLGMVFYDSNAMLVTISPSLQRLRLPEVDIHSVMKTKEAVEGVYKGGTKQRYYRAEPIVNSMGESIAAFIVIEDFSFFAKELRGRMLQALFTVLMSAIVLSIIGPVVIRRSITLPLQTFARRIEEIGQGQFDQRLQLTRRDEIGRLAQAFDRMCDRLEEAYQTLLAEGEEKLRLERNLRHSEKLAALGQIASRLAHEIGTPLNVIQGRAEQILTRDTLPEKDRAFMHVIVAQIERISGLIRQLLSLAQRPEPELRLVNLNDILLRAWGMLEHDERAGKVTLSLDLADNLPFVRGDPDQLQQVVLNLVVNAIQAMENNGHLTLHTRHLHGGTSSDHVVELEVADTGPGISSQDLPHLFESFFTTKSREGGTGLGLAICREIVLSHKGQIRGESDARRGARFIVSLPPVREAPVQSTRPALSTREDHYDNSAA